MMQPPGHIPGYHAPGTVVPIGAIIQAQEEAAQQQAVEAQAAHRRRRHFLLLLAR